MTAKPLHQQLDELRAKLDTLRARPPKTALQGLLHFMAGVCLLGAAGAMIWFWWAHVDSFPGQLGCGVVVAGLLFTCFQAFEDSGKP